MSLKASLPGVRDPIVGQGGVASRPIYTFFQAIATTVDALSTASSNVTIPDLPISENANVVSASGFSIYTQGTLKTGIVRILLDGDTQTPGNTQYYGSGPTGTRGWFSVSDALDSTSDITLSVGADGVSTVGLVDLANSGSGSALVKITRDSKGRIAGTSSATTSDLAEGSRLYYTDARVRAATLDGLSTATGSAVTAADSVLVGIGKLQAQATTNASAITGKESAIAVGTTAQYWRGDKSWSDFATDVRSVVLTGLSTATSAVIAAADSVLSALGKLQAQISAKTQAGTYATRPSAASAQGVTYYATDTHESFFSNGTSWALVGGGGRLRSGAETASSFTTTSTTAVDVTGMAITLTAGESGLVARFGGTLKISGGTSASVMALLLIVNGSQVAQILVPQLGNYLTTARDVNLGTFPPGSSVTVKLQLFVTSGTGELFGGSTDKGFLRVYNA